MDPLRQSLPSTHPQLADPDPLRTGQPPVAPTAPASTARAEPGRANHVQSFTPHSPQGPALPHPTPERSGPPVSAGMLAFLRSNGQPFPTSEDGTPLYKQNDRAAGGNWGRTTLGKERTIGGRGCAMTSMAMAVSKLSGQTVTPQVLDAYLDAHGGYKGDALVWSKAGQAVQPSLQVKKHNQWDLAAIDTSLAEGRPVVLAVDYKPGASGGSLGTDHWVCLTRRDSADPSLYYANDPATGEEIAFRMQKEGSLRQVPTRPRQAIKGYRTSGEFVTLGHGGAP